MCVCVNELMNSALVAVCLSDYEEFVRFVFDIFSFETEGEEMMSMSDYATVLQTILPSRNSEDR
jgi:hypothetical protein